MMLNNHRRHEFVAVVICFTILAFAGLIARLVSRRMKRLKLGVDDYLLLGGFVFMVGENALLGLSAYRHGTGQHMSELSMSQLASFQKELFASGVILPVCLYLSKLSLLLLYNRLFSVCSFRIVNYMLIAIITIWFIMIIFITFFLCHPIKSNWDITVKGRCIDRDALDKGTPIPWVLTDYAVLLAPLPYLRGLNMRASEKAAVLGLFCLGSFTCIVTTIRYGQLYLMKQDVTYGIYNLGIFSVVEGSVTVLCTSLIAAKPALATLIPLSWRESINNWLDRHYTNRGSGSWTPRFLNRLRIGDSATLQQTESGLTKTEKASEKSPSKHSERTLVTKPSEAYLPQLEFLTTAELSDRNV